MVLIPKREHSPTIKANETRVHEETRCAKFVETRRHNFGCRIQGVHHSAIHPNRDLLIQESSSIHSAKSRKCRPPAWVTNTEYFELCEIFIEKITCRDWSLHWKVGVVSITCSKCMQPSEKIRQLHEARYNFLSITD